LFVPVQAKKGGHPAALDIVDPKSKLMRWQIRFVMPKYFYRASMISRSFQAGLSTQSTSGMTFARPSKFQSRLSGHKKKTRCSGGWGNAPRMEVWNCSRQPCCRFLMARY